jgi:hypothetical protein
MPWRYRTLGIGAVVALNWAMGYFGIFVPKINVTAHHLILGPLVAVALLIGLFRAAKIDYLFP